MLFNLDFAQVNKVEHVDEKAIELVSNCVKGELGGKNLEGLILAQPIMLL